MGTSQSKPSAKGGSPLIPSWADQDPPPPGSAAPPPPKNNEVLEPRRSSGVRRSLKRFYETGDRRYAKRALGHFSRGAMGSGSAAGARMARAARTGGAAISALSSAISGEGVSADGFDLGALAGQPIGDAIGAIVDRFCPPGILDEDAIRAAISEALAEAFAGLDQFDPAALDNHAILVATRCFVTEMVFLAVTSEQGAAASTVPPQQAIQRENELRDVIREITDLQATPVLAQAGGALTDAQMETLIKSLATTVMQEAATW